MKKLAIVTTHPIQYYAPIFKLLQARDRIKIKVFYTAGRQVENGHDQGFDKAIRWDVPLLEGYDLTWLDNVAKDPGYHHFKGIDNPSAIKIIESWSPDAILVIGWACKSHLKIMRYFKNKRKVYFRGDSNLLKEGSGLKQILKTFLLRWVYQHVDHAFFVGKNNKEYYIKYGLKEAQLSFAPHAIDNDRFSEMRGTECDLLRTALNVGYGDILILFAGKFEPVKNIELLLSAFLSLNKPNIHLLVTGNGILENNLKKKARESSNMDKVHFMEFKNQTYMPVLYQSADLFCLPSKSESWGLSVNEAMACGKAVLVSDKVGCAADLIRPGVNGLVFDEGDEASLTASLDSLTNDKSQLGAMGEISRTIIAEWNFLNIVKAIEDEIDKN
ncbi:glycosyltransferase family 4 protein [Mucilaginibacter flavus]|uniref:glycosyltransferase family 4 protein n=1 Tax=Mucilaginibacter flavus TaxID=931504 RepID=UPI0025B570EA|nr:glycosyltransferase family 4 protein [Mucilaginibacter flavus]MDN3584426.1 glycosyltransferase family 4 protein [Mucilaginibacter flavus]